MLKSSWFQTWAGQTISSYLSDELGAEIAVGGIDIEFFRTAVLESIYIEDHHGDTLAYVPAIKADLASFSLEEKRIRIAKASLVEPRIKLKKYQSEDHLNFQFLVDYFGSKEETPKDSAAPWDISSDAFAIENAHFSLRNENVDTTFYGMNYDDLDLRKLNLELSEFQLDADTMRGKLDRLSVVEQCGFELDTLAGNLTVSPAGIFLDTALLKTRNSEVKMDLGFVTESYGSFSNFLEEVEHESHLRNTDFNLADLAYFVPSLEGIETNLAIYNAKVRGPVSQLSLKQLNLNAEHTRFKGDVKLLGLPDIAETFITINLKLLQTNRSALENIPLPPFTEKKYLALTDEVGRLGKIKMKGIFEGAIDNFVAQAKVRSNLGLLQSDIKVKQDSTVGYRFNGKVKSEAFDLGGLLASDDFGSLSIALELDSAYGDRFKNLHGFGSGQVSHFDYNGYSYSDIDINGELAKGLFTGKLKTNDENLKLAFNGAIDLSKREPEFKFDLDLDEAKLAQLNLVDRDSIVDLRTKMHINFKGDDLDHIEGEVAITDLHYQEGEESYLLESLMINADKIEEEKHLKIRSDILDAALDGRYNFQELPSSFIAIASKILPAYFAEQLAASHEVKVDERFNFSAEVKNFEPVRKLLIPDLYIPNGASLVGGYNASTGNVTVVLDADEVAYKEMKVVSNSAFVQKIGDRLEFEMLVDRFDLSDSLSVLNLDLVGDALLDNVKTSFSWNTPDSSSWGKLNNVTTIASHERFEIQFLPSYLSANKDQWSLPNDAQIIIDSTSLLVNHLSAFNGEQSITIDGKLSTAQEDKLNLDFENFALANFNPLLAASGVSLFGVIDGNGFVSDIYNDIFFESDLEVVELQINDYIAGDMRLKAAYDQLQKHIKVDGNLKRDFLESLGFKGFYYPENETNSLDLDVAFKEFPLKLINAFMPEESAELYGELNGGLKVKGTPGEPVVEGGLDFNRARANIALTNTAYRFSGHVGVFPDMITMDYIPLTDKFGHKGFITGTLLHENFSNMNFDVSVELDKLLCLNTTSEMGDLYYGTAFASGSVGVFGYADQLEVDAKVRTERGTDINLPLGGSTEISDQDFVTFYSAKDSALFNVVQEVDLSGIDMNFEMDVTEDAHVKLIFDEKVGDIMEGKGYGKITMSINTATGFEMFGKFTVTEGEYLFTLQNIINKKFNVRKGGTITWYGSPYLAELDLLAVYNLRTNLHDLYTENQDQYNKRIPVELGLKLGGTLEEMGFDFEVGLPTVDENTRSYVNSVLGTEQERNRQVFALLMLNKFLPLTQGAGNGLASGVENSSSEVLSNQLSNWISQISNDFDIGINYRPGDEITDKEIAVALSTQLFDERLTLSGNFGVSQGQSASSETAHNDLVGDFSVEYKITEDGRLKLRGFNESNDNDIANSDQAPFTQGVGVFYREQYDSIGEVEFAQGFFNLFRSKNNPKRKAFQEQKRKRREKKQFEKQREEAIREENKARYRKLTEGQ